MEYRKIAKNGDDISLLGFGVMRLKQNKGSMDIELAEKLIKYAVDNGVNYFDTAYLYGNGNGSNERALGSIIEKLGCRQQVYISTKMNRMIIKSKDDMEAMFKEELENLKTSYIDYYFIHNVISYQDVLDLQKMGLFEFIEDKKNKKEIINFGFSYHGSYNDFIKILDLYGWDMTLLQYNYLDNNMQAGIKGIKEANKRGMGVIIMEPLKGGLLAGTIPDEAQKIIDKSNIKRSNVDLALSWVYNTPEVTCVLSGMNDMPMLEENINITNKFSENPLTESELNTISEVKDVILKLNKINCTSCNYCMPCPQEINIPDTFRLYNDKYLFPEDKSYGINHSFVLYAANILGAVGKAHDASLCVDCGLCASKCPQQLEIPNLIRQVDKSFHGRYIRPFIPAIKKMMKIVL